MNNRVAARLFRAIEIASGVAPSRHLPALEESLWADAGELRTLQSERLAAIVRHAVAGSSFYRRHLPRHAIDSDVDAATRLASLPVLTKTDLLDNGPAMRVPAAMGRALAVSTSGSTGVPLHLSVDRPAFAAYFAAKLRALGWHGVRFSDRQLRVWGGTSKLLARWGWWLRDRLQNRLRLTTFDLSDDTLDRLVSRCRRFRPTYVNGYTSAVVHLAEHLARRGESVDRWGIRLVLPTSEVLLPWQRAALGRAFGAPVMNEYGCGEVQAIAYECPEGSLHPTHENLIVELLDENDRPVEPGREGLVTVTSLVNRAMPIVRYRIGDLASWSTAPECRCGRQPGSRCLERVTGRSSDVPYRTDGSPSHWGTIYYAIKDCFGPGVVDELQARQTALDRMEIQLVRGARFKQQPIDRFIAQLQSILGDSLEVEIDYVDQIEREPSGKLRYFVSELDVGGASSIRR